jgi:hypothetical protein
MAEKSEKKWQKWLHSIRGVSDNSITELTLTCKDIDNEELEAFKEELEVLAEALKHNKYLETLILSGHVNRRV